VNFDSEISDDCLLFDVEYDRKIREKKTKTLSPDDADEVSLC
jgi:hypothetical protein